MGSLTPPKTKEFPDSSVEKKVYNIVESFSIYLPIANDRNRLGFGLYKYTEGEGDPPEVLVKTSKLKLNGITTQELAKKISAELEKIK
jgi:hypothetical protein